MKFNMLGQSFYAGLSYDKLSEEFLKRTELFDFLPNDKYLLCENAELFGIKAKVKVTFIDDVLDSIVITAAKVSGEEQKEYHRAILVSLFGKPNAENRETNAYYDFIDITAGDYIAHNGNCYINIQFMRGGSNGAFRQTDKTQQTGKTEKDKAELKIIPISLKEANDFVTAHHRHHKAVIGCKFCIGITDYNDNLCGVAICGRPVSRFLDTGYTLEINRLCTIGARNACSMLYGACVRAARAMGYHTVVTYTLESENGASLKASNFRYDGIAGGELWTGSRKRDNGVPQERKKRWVYDLKKV